MIPAQLEERLSIVRWTPDVLADALGRHVSLVHAWLEGTEDFPPDTAAWIEALAITHAAAETIKRVGMEGTRAPVQ
jgi:hypothetical protein